MIAVSDYHKLYGQFVAVEGLSFHVEPGAILGLVGPNGAGKTTTLRAISGIIQPTRGRIAVDGHDLDSDPVAAKQALAFVPDDPRLFDALSVWEHLEFTASAYGVHDFEPKALALLERFELAARKDTLAQELSRGMRQKAAVCCALLHAPKALLFDEPLTGLDPRGIRTIKDAIIEHAAQGAAVIISSHLLELVEGMSSHLLILHHGQPLYCGPMDGLKEAFGLPSGPVSLETVFFQATEGGRETE